MCYKLGCSITHHPTNPTLQKGSQGRTQFNLYLNYLDDMSADGLNKTVLWIASSKQTVKSNIFDVDTNMTFTD